MRHICVLFLYIGAFHGAGRAVTKEDTVRHKQRMDDAEEIKYDVLDALQAKDLGKVHQAAGKLVSISQDELEYWKQTNLAEIVSIARQSVSLSKTLTEEAGKGNLVAAKTEFDQLLKTCAKCHDLHPESRVHVEH